MEKGRTEDVAGSFVRMVVLYKARPVEYEVWLVKVRTLDSIVAFPKRERCEGESSKPLKRKSTAEIGYGDEGIEWCFSQGGDGGVAERC